VCYYFQALVGKACSESKDILEEDEDENSTNECSKNSLEKSHGQSSFVNDLSHWSHDYSRRSHDYSSRSNNDYSNRSHEYSHRSHDQSRRSHDVSNRSHDHSRRSHDVSNRSHDHSRRSHDQAVMETEEEKAIKHGPYCEHYYSRQTIGKGAFGFVKIAYRRKDNKEVSV